MAQQVVHAVMVAIVRQCPTCLGTGGNANAGLGECPLCCGTGGSNEEIPLGDLVAMVASRLRLEARFVQKVGEG